jgi:hypothetical protein
MYKYIYKRKNILQNAAIIILWDVNIINKFYQGKCSLFLNSNCRMFSIQTVVEAQNIEDKHGIRELR